MSPLIVNIITNICLVLYRLENIFIYVSSFECFKLKSSQRDIFFLSILQDLYKRHSRKSTYLSIISLKNAKNLKQNRSLGPMQLAGSEDDAELSTAGYRHGNHL